MQPYRDYVTAPRRDPMIVAHRGAWGDAAPENSLAALEASIVGGYEIAEIDIRQSADGVLFLMHDATLERTTGHGGQAEDHNMVDLRAMALRAGMGGPNQPTGAQTIPTLVDALELVRGRVYLDLDVKRPALLAPVLAEVSRMGMGHQVDVKGPVRSRAEAAALFELGAQHNILTMPLAHIDETDADAVASAVFSMSPAMVELDFDTPEAMQEAARRFVPRGVSIWVNTLDDVAPCGLSDSAAVNDPDAVWGTLLRAGISIVQTDVPAALSEYLKSIGRRA